MKWREYFKELKTTLYSTILGGVWHYAFVQIQRTLHNQIKINVCIFLKKSMMLLFGYGFSLKILSAGILVLSVTALKGLSKSGA